MTIPSVRRFALALALGSSTLALAASAGAQTIITGTDPCPKGISCSTGPSTPNQASTAATSTKTTSTTSSTGSTVLQTVLVLLGVA